MLHFLTLITTGKLPHLLLINRYSQVCTAGSIGTGWWLALDKSPLKWGTKLTLLWGTHWIYPPAHGLYGRGLPLPEQWSVLWKGVLTKYC